MPIISLYSLQWDWFKFSLILSALLFSPLSPPLYLYQINSTSPSLSLQPCSHLSLFSTTQSATPSSLFIIIHICMIIFFVSFFHSPPPSIFSPQFTLIHFPALFFNHKWNGVTTSTFEQSIQVIRKCHSREFTLPRLIFPYIWLKVSKPEFSEPQV